MYEFRIARIEALGSGDVTTVEDLTEVSPWFEFQPVAAPARLTWTQGAPDGAWPVQREVENVEESLMVWTERPTAALRILTGALETATQWGVGFRRDMRLVAQIRRACQNPHYYEAQLYGGTAVPDGTARRLRVTWTREPYWRGPETLVPVRSAFSGAYGDYVTIYNHDDAEPGHNNWMFVQPPEGNVPALTRIRINNSYPGTSRLNQVRIGWYDRPINLVLEGEDAAGVTIWPQSGLSNDARGVAQTFEWTVPFDSVRDFVGPFRALANGSLSGQRWRLAVGYELTRLQYTRWIAGANGWTDLGLVMLPPGGYVHPLRYPFKVWLDGEDSSTSLDFLHFAPMQQYRRLQFKAYNAVYGSCIEDDDIRGETVYDFGGQRLPMLNTWGERIRLWPQRLLPATSAGQMLTFNLNSENNVATPLRTAQVQIFAAARWNGLPEA
jgi:hypothetical protein